MLRSIARRFPAIALHVHPHDSVPLLAWPDSNRPHISLINHADHVFWLGVTLADEVVCFRPTGAELSSDRRGVPSERIRTLPLPVDVPALPPRDAAREALGLGTNAVALLTVAANHKYQSLGGASYIDVIGPVLERHPNVVVLMVGAQRPSERIDDRGGRLRFCGLQPDPATYLAAADIYIDSAPMTSITSMLEAAASGLPVVIPCLNTGRPAVLCGVRCIEGPSGSRPRVSRRKALCTRCESCAAGKRGLRCAKSGASQSNGRLVGGGQRRIEERDEDSPGTSQ